MSLEGYYREKFSVAVSCLVGLPDIRTRIERALVSLTTVNAAEMKGEAGELYAKIYAMATSRDEDHEGEGKFRASLRHMSDEQADGIAHDLLSIYNSMVDR